MGRSRSRSHSRSRNHHRDSDSDNSSDSEQEGFRIHVGDLGIDSSRHEIEKVFEKFGPLYEVWLARNPPCFAFIVYRHKEDADEAIEQMNGKVVCGNRVKVGYALPRTRGRRQRTFDPNLRCYSCGERGHFSRDCTEVWKNKTYSAGFRARSRSSSRDRSRSLDRYPKGGRSRDRRSRSRERRFRDRRSRSRDRRSRDRRSRSRDRRSRDRRSRDRRSRSRDRRSKDRRSRERRSRSKDRKSRDRRSRSRDRKSRDRRSKSRDRSKGNRSRERRSSSRGGVSKSTDKRAGSKRSRSRERSPSPDQRVQSPEQIVQERVDSMCYDGEEFIDAEAAGSNGSEARHLVPAYEEGHDI